MLIVEKNRRFHTNLGENPSDPLDPDKLYQERYAKAKATATGVGKLVFAFIPFSIIRSFALAIDPLKKFKMIPSKYTPVNRTRIRTVASVLDIRKYTLKRSRQYFQSYIWATQGGPPGFFCYSPPILRGDLSKVVVIRDDILPRQEAVTTTTKDTTSRTRPAGSDFGEFETFSYKITSPTLDYRYYQSRRNTLTMSCNNQIDWVDDYFYTSNTGPGAVLSKTSLENLRTSEISELETIMQKRALGLLARTVPMSRRYSAFRNVVELKDLPHSILQLKRTIEAFDRSIMFHSLSTRFDIRKFINQKGHRNIPKEYLSYHFGWRQIIDDVMDLLTKPIRAANEVNRLMRRSGKPTTFRSFSKIAGKTTDTPGFDYDHPAIETFDISNKTSHSRQHELRCVVNATFDFPQVGIPAFKQELFLFKLGVYPLPTDLYNLIPWSWLVDWFTGLGNYVEAIDIINTDRSLINWGVLTGITNGKITTTHHYRNDDYWERRVDGNFKQAWTYRPATHESICNYKLQIRRDVSRAYGVKSIAEQGSLSPYQQSILAAILASRRK